MLQVLNSISKPPGSAPPFIPFKPVPRLVPLPSRHTLPVQQPNRFKLANFGHLREENLQMVLLARRITQQLVDIRQTPLLLPQLHATNIEAIAKWSDRIFLFRSYICTMLPVEATSYMMTDFFSHCLVTAYTSTSRPT